jgi:riboflavin biosynthesis pyrimidine reductase
VTRDEYISKAAEALFNDFCPGMLWTPADRGYYTAGVTAALDAVSSWETREHAEYQEKLFRQHFDQIAAATGCADWDYPGQVIRWVEDLAKERDRLRALLSRGLTDWAEGELSRSERAHWVTEAKAALGIKELGAVLDKVGK